MTDTTDLETNERPWGLMTDKECERMMHAHEHEGRTLLAYMPNGAWKEVTSPIWCLPNVYRLAPIEAPELSDVETLEAAQGLLLSDSFPNFEETPQGVYYWTASVASLSAAIHILRAQDGSQ